MSFIILSIFLLSVKGSLTINNTGEGLIFILIKYNVKLKVEFVKYGQNLKVKLIYFLNF